MELFISNQVAAVCNAYQSVAHARAFPFILLNLICPAALAHSKPVFAGARAGGYGFVIMQPSQYRSG